LQLIFIKKSKEITESMGIEIFRFIGREGILIFKPGVLKCINL